MYRYRTRLASLVLTLLLALGLAGWPVQAPPAVGQASPHLNVATSTNQIADMARNVAGDRAIVTGLIPIGADPHEYEPTTDDARTVGNADVILLNGAGLEKFVTDLAKNKRPATPLVSLAKGITLRQADLGGGGGLGDDPHIWLSAANAVIMTANIRDALIAADPDGEASYRANADAYTAQLQELDRWIFDQIATIPVAQRKLVTNHDAMGYYCDRYGLKFLGSIIPSTDDSADTSAADVARIILLVRQERVPAIFAESTTNPVLIERIAQQTGARSFTLYTDSLGPPGSGADTYLGYLRTDTRIIVTALGGP